MKDIARALHETKGPAEAAAVFRARCKEIEKGIEHAELAGILIGVALGLYKVRARRVVGGRHNRALLVAYAVAVGYRCACTPGPRSPAPPLAPASHRGRAA
jgi:hypothetical protein